MKCQDDIFLTAPIAQPDVDAPGFGFGNDGAQIEIRRKRSNLPNRCRHSYLLIINALLRQDAFLIRMFDLAHFGDKVGALDQGTRGVATGEHKC